LLDDASAITLGDEPVYVDGKFAGQATSASFGYRVQRPVILASLSTEACPNPEGARIEVDVAGERFAGSASLKPAFDAKGARMHPGNFLKAVL
jgi:4-methylaminobutanoate oxidase (formaldehyde-forming)